MRGIILQLCIIEKIIIFCNVARTNRKVSKERLATKPNDGYSQLNQDCLAREGKMRNT